MSPAPRARRRDPAARRAQILAAAFRCFADKGFHAARMDDLVDASGLSKGSLYWHFDSKEDVFLALFDLLEAEVFAAWDDEAHQTASVITLLRREGAIALERMVSQRAVVGAWMEFLAHPAARSRMKLTYERSRARLAALVERGVEAGEIREDVPKHDAAALVTGAVEGLVLQHLVDPELDVLAGWERAWTVLERGLVR